MRKDIKRTTVSLPAHLMEKLERLARERGQTPSTMIGGWLYDLPSPCLNAETQDRQQPNA